jgi:pimeloyl-ACP methyl ester carboxylesterase
MNIPLIAAAGLGLPAAWIASAFVLAPRRERLDRRSLLVQDWASASFARADGFELAYHDLGPRDGPAVVLIHGFGAWSYAWRAIAPRLAEAGYRAIAVDQLGNGASERPRSPCYDTRRQAGLILGLMDALGIRQAHLAGHSVGGRVAMQVAIVAPERTASLIAAAPDAYSEARPPVARLLGVPLAGYAVAYYTTVPELAGKLLRFAAHASDWLTPEVARGYSAPLTVRGTVWAQVWQARSPKDGADPVPGNLGRIAAPALLIWGREDRVFPVDHGHKLAASLPAAELRIIDGAGHLVYEEEPGQVADAMLEFLGRQVARGMRGA